MPQKCSVRRTRLVQLRTHYQQLSQLNDIAGRVESQLKAQGVESEEIIKTMNLILSAGGPPNWTANSAPDFSADGSIDLPFNVGTISDRVANLLMQHAPETLNQIDWEAKAESEL